MKLGYAVQNIATGLTTNKNIRLSAFTEKRFLETVSRNLSHLACIIGWNQVHDLLMFRIGSRVIPFASHPVCCIDWQGQFRDELRQIGALVKQRQMRITMHADQFVVLSSPEPAVVQRSIDELGYLCEFIDLMDLDDDSRVQLHVGGIYGNKRTACKRFISVYRDLPDAVHRRLAIENDDRLFSVRDCLHIHAATGIPVILDCFHHACLNNGETLSEVMQSCSDTWQHVNGIPIIEYSQQQPGERKGSHCRSLDIDEFARIYSQLCEFNFDLLLEAKDREKSALQVQSLLNNRVQSTVTWIQPGIPAGL